MNFAKQKRLDALPVNTKLRGALGRGGGVVQLPGPPHPLQGQVTWINYGVCYNGSSSATSGEGETAPKPMGVL